MDHLMTLATSLLSSTASRLATVNDGHNDTATYSYLANSPLKGSVNGIDILLDVGLREWHIG